MLRFRRKERCRDRARHYRKKASAEAAKWKAVSASRNRVSRASWDTRDEICYITDTVAKIRAPYLRINWLNKYLIAATRRYRWGDIDERGVKNYVASFMREELYLVGIISVYQILRQGNPRTE